MNHGDLRAAFLDGERGRLFALMRKPAQAVSQGVLVVPPFAEEMNKSRHLFTEAASQLAARGVASVMVDPFGTGDSEGEFADADWRLWKADLAVALAWARAEGVSVTGMLAVRLGCALGCELAREQALNLQQTVFWQPVLNGNRALDQFLRLRVAATMMQGDGKETIASLRARLKNGECVTVAGYDVTGTLADQLDRVQLQQALSPQLGRLHWMEVVRAADAAPPTPSINAIEQARSAGMSVELATIQGEPFWSSVELVRNAQLIERTAHAFGSALVRRPAAGDKLVSHLS